jgi:hypothetical protein
MKLFCIANYQNNNLLCTIISHKKLAREFYKEETAKEFIKSFNRVYKKSEYARHCINRAIQNNIKKKEDALKEVEPN